jgi:hypothetical protein
MRGGSFRKSRTATSTIFEGKNGHQQVVHQYASSIRSSWRLCPSAEKIRSSTSAENVGRIWASFVCSAQKRVRISSGKLKTQRSTLHRELHMHARLKFRWLSDPVIIHCVKHSPQSFLKDQINTNGFLQKIFSDEATFYVSGRINAQNVKNRGYESLHALFVHPNPVCRRTIPVSIHAFCDSRVEGLLGNVLWFSAQKLPWVGKSDLFSANHAAHWAFPWDFYIFSFLCNK